MQSFIQNYPQVCGIWLYYCHSFNNGATFTSFSPADRQIIAEKRQRICQNIQASPPELFWGKSAFTFQRVFVLPTKFLRVPCPLSLVGSPRNTEYFTEILTNSQINYHFWQNRNDSFAVSLLKMWGSVLGAACPPTQISPDYPPMSTITLYVPRSCPSRAWVICEMRHAKVRTVICEIDCEKRCDWSECRNKY